MPLFSKFNKNSNNNNDGSNNKQTKEKTKKDTAKKPVTAADLGLTEAQAEETKSALIQHAYHLPGMSWVQDWYQYMTNNHPLLGIFLHHPLHPVKAGVRLASMIGSLSLGLALTCIIYEAFVFSQENYNKQYIELSTNKTRTGLQSDLDNDVSVLSVTNGNIALWTVGAFLNGLYDNTVWALAAGTFFSCCNKDKEGDTKQTRKEREEKFQKTGTFLVVLSVIIVIALTFFAVSLQNAITTNNGATVEAINGTDNGAGYADVGTTFRVKKRGPNNWEFIIAYVIEVALSFFVYYPIIGTIMFSGVLSCGKYWEVTGGRPYEIAHAEAEAMEEGKASKNSTDTKNNNNNKGKATTNAAKKAPVQNKKAATTAASNKKPAAATSAKNTPSAATSAKKKPAAATSAKKKPTAAAPAKKKPAQAPKIPSNTKRQK